MPPLPKDFPKLPPRCEFDSDSDWNRVTLAISEQYLRIAERRARRARIALDVILVSAILCACALTTTGVLYLTSILR